MKSKWEELINSAWLPMAAMVLALGFFIWIILQIRARYRESDDPAESTHEMLTQYRELRERGEISEEEFRLIKSRLANNLERGGPSPNN